MKRIADLWLTIFLLGLLSPFMIMIAILIRLKIGSPIVFKQQRPGLYAKPFYIYKFRTMSEEKDAFGNLLPDEYRITYLGKILRKFSLDELPQLINVIKGELSLVGPRPLLMEYLPLYSQEQARRHNVKPGITGWAQVNGRNAISWEEKFKLDIWYVDNWSFWLDIRILLQTFWKSIKQEGINQPGQATMEEFTGHN